MLCSCDKWSYYEKKLTYNRCVVEIYVNFEQISHLRYVCSCDKWSYYEKKLTYNRCVVEIHVHFLPN